MWNFLGWSTKATPPEYEAECAPASRSALLVFHTRRSCPAEKISHLKGKKNRYLSVIYFLASSCSTVCFIFWKPDLCTVFVVLPLLPYLHSVPALQMCFMESEFRKVTSPFIVLPTLLISAPGVMSLSLRF